MAAQVTTPSHFQRALFANTDSRSANHSLLPHSIWTSRIMFSAQALAFPLAFWFKPACLFLALVWLSYRAYQVLNKPLEELASLLGFDIPFTPIIDLAGVKADGAVIHWSLPEKQKQRNTLKYEIHMNGTVIDTVSLQESAVSITGLQPDSFYVVRVALVNSLEFSSKSAPIRFRTKQASSGDYYRLAGDVHENDGDASQEAVPHVKPFRGLKDFTPASPEVAAPPMTRENSSGGLHKRSITGRRPSPVALGLETRNEAAIDAAESFEGAETIQQLTARLDQIRFETDETERLAKEEEEEEMRQKEELIAERDALKAEALEKDKVNRNLKREVNILERQNTAAQNERTKHERMLQQKKQERQKLKEDSIRWEQEAVQLKEEAEQIKQQKLEYLEESARQKETLTQQQVQEAAELKSLDDEVRLKVIEIKKLDRAAKNGSPNGAEPEQNSLAQQYQLAAQEENAHRLRYSELMSQYGAQVKTLENAKVYHTNCMRWLESVRAERRRTDEVAVASAAREYPSPPPASERGIRRGDSQRSRNTNNDSPRMSTFPAVTSSPFGGGLTSTSGFSTAPFLNIHNGMTIARPSESMSMSDEERDRLTGGAPMSPGAGAELIPADLFSNDDNRPGPEDVKPIPGLGSLPGFGGMSLPGLGTQPGQQEYQNTGPASPTSPPSRAPSLFSSPRVSQNNLPTSPDNYMDSDRRSIHSTRSNRAISSANAGSRFSSMFGIKPRAKNTSLDETSGPALGKVQSQSMPRQDQGIPGLDSATRKRNSSISGTMFGDVLGNPSGADAEGGAEDTSNEPTSQPRRRVLNLNPFSKDKGPDGWPSNFLGRRPASPRPGSTHSSDLPRPSFDSTRWGSEAWPSSDAASGARGSPLSFGGWNAPGPLGGGQQSRIFGSRHPSRRPSVQHGGSGPPEDIMEDEDSDALDADRRPHLAPIGTKPPPGSKQSKQVVEDPAIDPKLNPNAKDFKSFFNSIKLSSKDKDKLKEAEASGSQTPSNLTPGPSTTQGLMVDDESPPASRKSRDARSTTTIESSVGESMRNSNDLARTPSYSNASETASNASPMIGSGSLGKESFMAKLTRKSSSGMAFLPTFKRDKSRLEPAATEDDDEALSASASSIGRESREANRSSRSWGNALKLGKSKKGGETPSVSGLSITSGADEEEQKESR